MDLLSLAESPAAAFIASFSPTARSLLEFARNHADTLRAVIPVIRAAASEGPAVIDAVRRTAPDTIETLKALIETFASPRAPIRAAVVSDVAMENSLRSLAGLPRMTPAQETAWLDRMNPISQDSRSGSG